LPPHFDGRWFVADFNRNTLDTVSLNEDGTRKAQGRVFSHVTLTQPIDVQIGPDGALYIINYAGWFNSSNSTTILRIDYMGTCRPNPLSGRKTAPPGMFSLRGMMAEVGAAAGKYVLSVTDLRGKTLATIAGQGAGIHDMSPHLRRHSAGLYLLHLKGDAPYSRPLMWSRP
jgi:hypothetical protein